MNRVSKYIVSIVGREFRLKITDIAGNFLYELTKTVKIATNSTGNSAQSSTNTVTNTQNDSVSSN